MDPLSIAVLGAAVAATLWLVLYVKVLLPKKVDERYLDTMQAFSHAIELRFPGQSGLTQDVETIALQLGRDLGLSRPGIKRLIMAARLRDVGLCAIPYALVNRKAFHEWSVAEQLTYEHHPEVSGAMLDLVPSLRELSEIVRCHHANFDGTSFEGSPVGEDIPLEARILRVSVDYAWRTRLDGNLRAQDFIIRHSGSLFCPEVVGVLASLLNTQTVHERERSAIA